MMEVVSGSPNLVREARWVLIRLHVRLWAHEIMKADQMARFGGGAEAWCASPAPPALKAIEEKPVRWTSSEAGKESYPSRRRGSVFEGDTFHDSHPHEIALVHGCVDAAIV